MRAGGSIALTPLLSVVLVSAVLIAVTGTAVAIVLFKSAKRADWEQQSPDGEQVA